MHEHKIMLTFYHIFILKREFSIPFNILFTTVILYYSEIFIPCISRDHGCHGNILYFHSQGGQTSFTYNFL